MTDILCVFSKKPHKNLLDDLTWRPRPQRTGRQPVPRLPADQGGQATATAGITQEKIVPGCDVKTWKLRSLQTRDIDPMLA